MKRLLNEDECATLAALATDKDGLNALVTCQGEEGYIRNLQSDVVRAIDAIYRQVAEDDKDPLYVNCGRCLLTYMKKVANLWDESRQALATSETTTDVKVKPKTKKH